MNSEELVKNVLKDVEAFSINDVPNIELYMDQVTTYLNNKFSASKRYEDDKLLTKTMINNYAKSRLLPPLEKKKYSKDHIIVLALIFFFKNVISINDVTTVLKPLLDKYFHNEETPLEDIVNVFLNYVQNSDMTNPIIDEFHDSIKIFENVESDDKEYLQTLGLISMLSYDMFVRKMLIEKLIDSLPENEESKTPKENKKDHNKKETD
ncbi:MAG: DUF1836 domain-containing protein [Eubacterium sp.]